MEINKIYNCDCIDGLRQLPENSVDLTVTSPPYDNLRTYHAGDEFRWDFEIFKPIADELYRVTKPGCVVVWVVGDATINGDETGTSFKQAEYFKQIGFKLHDTMIYEKNGSSRPAGKNAKRYSQIFEYMFIFVKGEIRKDITLIADKRNKWYGWAKWGKNTTYDVDGNLVEVKKNQPVIKEYSYRNNIWRYSVSFNDKTGHPAVFPELLAQDHILSWSVEGDLVLDPFMGSGTTAKMAKLNKRNYIGFEKNTEYYEKSLERVAKYDGQVNTNIETTTIETEDGEEMEVQYSTSEDKEFEKKSKLWNEYIEKLNQYFDEQTYGTLKTLQFNFVSKTNEERVKKITEQENVIENTLPNMQHIVMNRQPSLVPGEALSSPDRVIRNLSTEDNNKIEFSEEMFKHSKTLNNVIIETVLNNEDVKEYILNLCADYFHLNRLTDAMVEVNRKAKEEKQKKVEQPERKNPIQFVQLREQDFVKKEEVKPKRKRRTKAEMEEARRLEAEKKWEKLGLTKDVQEDIKQHVKDLEIRNVKYEGDNNVTVEAVVSNGFDHIETVINPDELITAQADFTVNIDENSATSVSVSKGEPNTSCIQYDDDLPFVFDNEEERQRIVGNPLGDIVDGKPVYIEQQPVEVKKHRGRPRKK